jgi:hypothetical protein
MAKSAPSLKDQLMRRNLGSILPRLFGTPNVLINPLPPTIPPVDPTFKTPEIAPVDPTFRTPKIAPVDPGFKAPEIEGGPDTGEQERLRKMKGSGLLTEGSEGEVEKGIKIPKGVKNYLENVYGEVNLNDNTGDRVRQILQAGVVTEKDKEFLVRDIIGTDAQPGGSIDTGIDDAYDDPTTRARLKRQLKSLKDFEKKLIGEL